MLQNVVFSEDRRYRRGRTGGCVCGGKVFLNIFLLLCFGAFIVLS